MLLICTADADIYRRAWLAGFINSIYMSVMPHKIKGFKLLGVRLDINSK